MESPVLTPQKEKETILSMLEDPVMAPFLSPSLSLRFLSTKPKDRGAIVHLSLIQQERFVLALQGSAKTLGLGGQRSKKRKRKGDVGKNNQGASTRAANNRASAHRSRLKKKKEDYFLHTRNLFFDLIEMENEYLRAENERLMRENARLHHENDLLVV